MKINANGIIRTAAAAGGLSLGLLLAACSGRAPVAKVNACKNGISQAFNAIEQAKADGFGSAVDLTRAGSLLSAAKVQQQFERYDGCIDKTERALYYANLARGGN